MMPILFGSSAFAQDSIGNRIALKMDGQTDYYPTTEQFNQAFDVGIDMLELSFPNSISETVLDKFHLLLDTRQRFLTASEIKTKAKLILNSQRAMYGSVPTSLQDNIVAIKLFDYPADYSPGFPAAVRNICDQLSVSIDKPFYYQSAFTNPSISDGRFDFVSGRIAIPSDSVLFQKTSVYLFEPSDRTSESLQELQHVLNQSLSSSDSIIIIPAKWFFTRLKAQPAFVQVISSYLEGNRVSIPLPANDPPAPAVNWHILFLLAIWACFILHYKYQPIYKSSLPRYFFSHSFFVSDVMEHRIRNASPGVIVLVLHSLLTGFMFYLLAYAFMSGKGLASLSYHFPAIIFNGFEIVCIFVIGVLTGLFSHVISIIWLYIFNKQLRHIHQAINLYSWPLHINLGIVTLTVYIIQINGGNKWLLATFCAFFLVWFISFYMAATDGARQLKKFRALNVLLTIGLHFILITSAIVFILLFPFILEPLKMAFTLP